MELGKNIVKIRKDNKLTQDDLAEKYYVTRQTISNWENGKSYPDLETLVKISDDFNISLDLLLKEDNKMVKDISKKQKTYKLVKILVILYILLVIGIIGFVFWMFTQQYNPKGISHSLIITIDEKQPKEYIGKLNNYNIYVEKLNINDLYFKTKHAQNIPIKEAIEKELISIEDWRKYSRKIIKIDNTEIIRYENYEIAITNDECIIRPITK